MTTPSDLARLPASQQQLIEASLSKNAAAIRRDSEMRPRLQLRIPLELDAARTAQNPFVISAPFTAFYVEEATDTNVSIRMSLTSPEGQNISQYTTLRENDSGEFEDPIRAAYLTWPAQVGKTLTLVIYLGVAFRPGSQISVNSGGVSINDGSAVANSVVTLAAAAATVLFAADATRKVGSAFNDTGATLYLGGTATVTDTGATKGFPWLPGAPLTWRNTAALYCYNPGGTVSTTILTET